MSLHVPTSTSLMPDWVRKAANAINDLIRQLLTAQGSITTLQASMTAAEGDIDDLEAWQAAPVNAQGIRLGARTVTSAPTIVAGDYLINVDATAGAVTVALPAAASSAGRVLAIKKIDVSVNTVTVDADGSELIDGLTTQALLTQYASLRVHCDGAAWWIA